MSKISTNFRTGNNALFRISFSAKTKARGEDYPSNTWRDAAQQAHDLGDQVYNMLRQTGFYTHITSYENNRVRMWGDSSQPIRTIVAGRGNRPNTRAVVKVIRNPQFTDQHKGYKITTLVDDGIFTLERAIERGVKIVCDPRLYCNRENLLDIFVSITGRKEAILNKQEFSAVAQLDYIILPKERLGVYSKKSPKYEIILAIYQNFSLREVLFKYSLIERSINKIGEKTFAVFRFSARPILRMGDLRDYLVYSGRNAILICCFAQEPSPAPVYR